MKHYFGFKILLVLFILTSCDSKQPDNLGFGDNGFASCGDDCFSTTETDPKKQIDKLKYSGDKAQALAEMKKYAMQLGKATVISETSEYLHLRYDRFLGSDDLEVYINEAEGKIEYKSASRGGIDFGANKSRVHDLGFKYIQRGM